MALIGVPVPVPPRARRYAPCPDCPHSRLTLAVNQPQKVGKRVVVMGGDVYAAPEAVPETAAAVEGDRAALGRASRVSRALASRAAGPC